MPMITVEVTENTAANLAKLVKRCNEVERARNGSTSHGELTIPDLLAMMAEDAAYIIKRPGCWEATNMRDVINAHGYDF
jgi:hypothetical protein